jgi:hypothetical protein
LDRFRLLEDSLDRSKLLDGKGLLVSGLMVTEESSVRTGALLTAGNAGAAALTVGSATGGAMTGLAATMLGGSTGGLVTGLKLAAGGSAAGAVMAGLAAMAALGRAGVALVPRLLAKAVSVGLLAVVVPSLALFNASTPLVLAGSGFVPMPLRLTEESTFSVLALPGSAGPITGLLAITALAGVAIGLMGAAGTAGFAVTGMGNAGDGAG